MCGHLRGQAEDLLYQLLGLGGFLQEQFDDGSQELQLNLEEPMETRLEFIRVRVYQGQSSSTQEQGLGLEQPHRL